MQRDHSRDVNPNLLHGCHPLDLSSYFGEVPFDLTVKNTEDAPPEIPYRLQVLERILNNISRSSLPAADYFAEHMRQRYRRNHKTQTLKAAATGLKQFLSFYRQSGKKLIEQMTRDDIEAFTESLQDRGLKPSSVACRLRVVYGFIRFLIDREVLGYELLERRIKIKRPKRLPRAMGPDDVRKLVLVLDKVRVRALILLLLRTGMRIGELLKTKVHDVDLHNNRILIYQAEKNDVGRVAYFSDDAKQALLSWMKTRNSFQEYLFYGHGSRPLSYQAARMTFIRCLEKAGLSYSGYTLHSLRHTFATELLNARMPLECLRVLLGHSTLEVTRIYARLSDKTREHEYFMAMDRILKGETDADDQFDY